ncbi:MAG: fatty acid desaturase [Frankiales bacterium]|jgi:acyl-[acyl-carrier-protein] desaturase|nr:fatty acid desaturase [Frankiales bacterium]
MTTALVRPELLTEHLTARLEVALAAHLERAQTWYPHEYVPWGEARDFAELPFEETQSRLSKEVRASVSLNLLTEDNLPGYHGAISRVMGYTDVWRTWLDRWTAEEGRHGIALRDYLTVTRAVDPVVLEEERMATVSGGFDAGDRDGLRVIAYVSMQELATRVAHRGTGRFSTDEGLDRLLSRISTDENLHMVLYRDLFAAALEVDPVTSMQTLLTEVVGFQMPGTGIPGFVRRAAVVARSGIYDLTVHREQVLTPLLRFWEIFERDLPPEACATRDQLALVLAEIDARAARQRSRSAPST